MADADIGSSFSKEKIKVTKHSHKRKRGKLLSQFFKFWATPITILIAIGGLIWGAYQFNAQQAANQAQALDQQRQDILDTYVDRISDLIMMEGLATSKSGSEVRAIAEARTLIAVRSLDGERKGTLIRYLWTAKLINMPQPILNLAGANLRGAIIENTILSGIDLSGANLSGANLSGADLNRAIVTSKQLATAKSLGGTTMPSGSIHP